jgi:hypothetical protein
MSIVRFCKPTLKKADSDQLVRISIDVRRLFNRHRRRRICLMRRVTAVDQTFPVQIVITTHSHLVPKCSVIKEFPVFDAPLDYEHEPNTESCFILIGRHRAHTLTAPSHVLPTCDNPNSIKPLPVLVRHALPANQSRSIESKPLARHILSRSNCSLFRATFLWQFPTSSTDHFRTFFSLGHSQPSTSLHRFAI